MSDKILRGVPIKFSPIKDKGLGEYFFDRCQNFGDKVFQIDGDTGKQETYNVVKLRTTRFAIYLQNLGISPKDIVAICCKNNINNVVPIFAALYLGAVVSSLDPKQTIFDVKHSLKLLKPKLIIVEADSLNLIEESLKNLDLKPIIISIGNSSRNYPDMLEIEKEAKWDKDFRPVPQKGSDVALVFFSSGTTSTPKGIYLSNFALLNVAQALIQHNHIKLGVIMHLSSLYWMSAWCLTAAAIISGGAKVIGHSIDAEKFLKLIEKHKVTHVFGHSMLTYQITSLERGVAKKYDTSSLLAMTVGGSTVDPNQFLRLIRYLPHSFCNLVYGSSEASFISAHDYGKNNDVKTVNQQLSSSGTLIPGVEMKVVDEDTGKALGPDQQGEICVKTPYAMSGYHNFINPNAYDKDGFLRTGDLGYYDKDGYVYVIDRLGETFKYLTGKISPSVIENILMRHPAVKEAVAFGVPNDLDDNHPAACVTLKNNANVNAKDLEDYVNQQVSDNYKLRGGVGILKEIPRTPTGKLLRRKARDVYMKEVRNIPTI